jgi:hypothetical protein
MNKTMNKNYSGITGKNSGVISILFFIFGIIGAIGFRAVLLVNNISSFLASFVWYIAVISYIIFYIY